MDPVQLQILHLIDAHPGQLSWYQLDRMLAEAGFLPGKKLLVLLDEAVRAGRLTSSAGHHPAQPVYTVTPEGRRFLGATQL